MHVLCFRKSEFKWLWTQLIKKRTKGLVVVGGLIVGLGMLTLSTTADLVEFQLNITLQVGSFNFQFYQIEVTSFQLT